MVTKLKKFHISDNLNYIMPANYEEHMYLVEILSNIKNKINEAKLPGHQTLL